MTHFTTIFKIQQKRRKALWKAQDKLGGLVNFNISHKLNNEIRDAITENIETDHDILDHFIYKYL